MRTIGLHMTKGSAPTKSKEKRLEEKEKWEVEAARSIAVARVKEAHKLIEDAEKNRKRSTIFSINDRLLTHTKLVIGLNSVLSKSKSKFADYEITPAQRVYIKDLVKIYESIRYDLQKAMEMKDEELEKLFPKLEVDFGEFIVTLVGLQSIVNQMIDMSLYSKRMWR